MHETTLRGIGTVVTLVSGRQRMGPIKEMSSHAQRHTYTWACPTRTPVLAQIHDHNIIHTICMEGEFAMFQETS